MKNILRHPKHSLAAKLIIAIGLLMIFGSSVFWLAILHKQDKDLTSIAIKYGDSFVDFVKQSTRYSMLTFHRTGIQQTLEDISLSNGIENVNIFDHNGRVFYSSSKKNIGTYADSASISCRGCHIDTTKSAKIRTDQKRWTVYKNPDGVRALKLVAPIYNENACYTSDCHVHPKEQKILGLVEADMSLGLLDEAKLKQGLALTLYIVVFFVAGSFALWIILWRLVSKPVTDLTYGMEKLAEGDFNHEVPIKSDDEMGVLARTFNSMTADLKGARDQRELWTQTLEAEIDKQTEEIQKTHASLLQTEKLASLGRMAAGVAHEINNPLTGVVTFAHLMLQRVPPDSLDAEDLQVIIEQAERCSKIIKNLLTFSRATPSEKGAVNINNVLSKTIYMVKNQEKFHNIKFNTNIDDTPLITIGDSSQFQQICLNMLLNAADAMNERGVITVATRKITKDNKNYVEIEFTDTGAGIKKEAMAKLFEPFFTTKPVDKGTGLGLSVSHGIVKHAGGEIKVKSAVGKGTSFFVRLPLKEGDE